MNMMNGMNFGMDGPQVTGWWYNPTTGDKFNALDTYFEGNNLLIKTADGRLLNYNQIQNYVQVEKPEMIPSKPIASTPKNQSEEIPAEVLAEIEGPENDLLIPDDNIYGVPSQKQIAPSTELGNLYSPLETPVNQNLSMIKRALDGKSSPSVNGSVYWEGFPKREIEMLVDVMQIPENEIVEYYINNISINYIKDIISNSVRGYISTQLHPTIPAQETAEVVNTFDNGMLRVKTIEKSQPTETKPKKTKKKVDE